MSLNECTRKPISSCEVSGRRVSRSPCATARVPFTRSWIGCTSRCAVKIAPYHAASSDSSSTTVSVRMKLALSGLRR